MKSILIFCFFISLNASNTIIAQGRNCEEPGAISGYKEVDDLVDQAKTAGNNGEYKIQKELAKKAVTLSKKIEKKYQCYSIVAYWALSDAYANLGDFDGALKNSQEALNFCDKFKRDDCKCKSTTEMKIGTAYSAMGNDSLALIEYKKALDLCKDEYGQKLMQAYILQATGSLELKTGNSKSALEKLTLAKSIVQETGIINEFSQQILGRCYLSIGIVLYQNGICDDALPKFLTGLQIAKDIYDNKTAAFCNYYIARIYDNKANYSEALLNYSEAISIAEKMGDTTLIVDSHNFMGSIYTSTGKNDLAAEKVALSFKLAKLNGYKKGMVDSYNIDAWNKKELFTDSNMIVIDIISQAKTALTMSMDIGYKEGMAEAYNNLETYYENKKEYKLALKYAKLAYSLADSIGYTMVVADALNDFGDIWFKQFNNSDSAIYYYKLSIEKAKLGSYNACGIYKEGIVDSYNKIGNVYLKKKKKDIAYENFYHALEFSKEIDYEEGVNEAINGISLVEGNPASKGKSKKPKIN